jgi:hypothetical protein
MGRDMLGLEADGESPLRGDLVANAGGGGAVCTPAGKGMLFFGTVSRR